MNTAENSISDKTITLNEEPNTSSHKSPLGKISQEKEMNKIEESAL